MKKPCKHYIRINENYTKNVIIPLGTKKVFKNYCQEYVYISFNGDLILIAVILS